MPVLRPLPPTLRTLSVHIALLLLTFLTTAIAGVSWQNVDPWELSNISAGLQYALLLLGFLVAHEAGHYVAARIHKVSSSLPYFIPLPALPGMLTFGTLGAVIRLRGTVGTRKALFDIAAAGPLAGFLYSLLVLIIGTVTLPPISFIYKVHPDYLQTGIIPTEGFSFGHSILFSSILSTFGDNADFIPPMNEVYHYPNLCVGWFGLFVTAMNLLPVGQLDGGHLTYAMFGKRHHIVAQVTMIVLLFLGTAGFLVQMGVALPFGWMGWIFWALLLIAFQRSNRFRRVPLADDAGLNVTRKVIGWLCIVIFLVTFSPTPFSF